MKRRTGYKIARDSAACVGMVATTVERYTAQQIDRAMAVVWRDARRGRAKALALLGPVIEAIPQLVSDLAQAIPQVIHDLAAMMNSQAAAFVSAVSAMQTAMLNMIPQERKRTTPFTGRGR